MRFSQLAKPVSLTECNEEKDPKPFTANLIAGG